MLLRVSFDEFGCKKLLREILKGLIPIIRTGLHGLTFYGQKPVRREDEGGNRKDQRKSEWRRAKEEPIPKSMD